MIRVRTISWLAVICVIAAFVVALIIPNIIPPRSDGHNACINNLRQIDTAKQEWALEHHATNGEVVTVSEITIYLYQGVMPKCPSGGIYTIGKIGEPPTCSLGATVNPPHILP